MPHDLSSSPAPKPAEPRGSLLSRIIEAHNPGVTFLVAVWVAGYSARQLLDLRGLLTDTLDDALTSLLFVVPIMLLGWGALALLQRLTGVRFFDSEE